MKRIITTAAMVLFMSTTAFAGQGTFKKADGSKVRVSCSGSGCTSIYYNKSGKRVDKKKGPGGSRNYRKIKKMLKNSGYK